MSLSIFLVGREKRFLRLLLHHKLIDMAAQVVRRRACLNLPDEGMQALDELGRHDVLPGNEDVVQPTPGQQGDVVG